ncbi:hypothetical protein CALCODRAFT_18126 [Calocera cornea HHB12733]|uniref:Uncharacterized protein n=1 Tax=Calocera cornea HHB12733 TaxID=1353952 RepID=A0A165E840_9BASI|nr:hypothetical protein CALCODRAFT_18126 [Calocera cornea HHB12733]
MMSTVKLNHDLFALVTDEVLYSLNLLRTKDWIDLAHTLRRVNRYADERLTADARRYLDIPSPDALLQLAKRGSPCYPVYESLTIHFHPYTTAPQYKHCCEVLRSCSWLCKLVLDLRFSRPTQADLGSPAMFMVNHVPDLMEELAVLTGDACSRDPRAGSFRPITL